jgi:predicted nucleotidyltransferase
MFDMTQISDIAGRIKSGLGADTRVFLFGSYAWGEPNEDSDLDFAVVVPDLMYDRKTAVKARKVSGHGLIPIDVLAYRASFFSTAISGSLAFEIRTKGREL